MPKLSEEERERYQRQIMIFGEGAQRCLKNATVGVVGLGGLGSPASLYLAAAGVGKLLLVDSEPVELSNLNRQILHGEGDIGGRKTTSAQSTLRKLNSNLLIETIDTRLEEENIELIKKADLIVDGLDNFKSRYLINELCVMENIPLIHGAVEGNSGQLTTIIPYKTPCLKCLFPEPPEKQETFPILGATAGLFGILLANEAIKVITGTGTPLTGKLLFYDLSENKMDMVGVKKDPGCPLCGR